MAIVEGSLVEIVVEQHWLGQTCLNAWQYQISAFTSTVTPANILEAYWDNVKDVYRSLYPNLTPGVLTALRIRELNNALGDYAEYAIPADEQSGTRAVVGATDPLPPFAAGSVRLVVGSRATRPGQKRFAGACEGDQSAGVLGGTFVEALDDIGVHMSVKLILGAPAALVGLQPIVVRKDADGAVTAHQNVTGYLVNPNVSTQNTRKIGRGV